MCAFFCFFFPFQLAACAFLLLSRLRVRFGPRGPRTFAGGLPTHGLSACGRFLVASGPMSRPFGPHGGPAATPPPATAPSSAPTTDPSRQPRRSVWATWCRPTAHRGSPIAPGRPGIDKEGKGRERKGEEWWAKDVLHEVRPDSFCFCFEELMGAIVTVCVLVSGCFFLFYFVFFLLMGRGLVCFTYSCFRLRHSSLRVSFGLRVRRSLSAL